MGWHGARPRMARPPSAPFRARARARARLLIFRDTPKLRDSWAGLSGLLAPGAPMSRSSSREKPAGFSRTGLCTSRKEMRVARSGACDTWTRQRVTPDAATSHADASIVLRDRQWPSRGRVPPFHGCMRESRCVDTPVSHHAHAPLRDGCTHRAHSHARSRDGCTHPRSFVGPHARRMHASPLTRGPARETDARIPAHSWTRTRDGCTHPRSFVDPHARRTHASPLIRGSLCDDGCAHPASFVGPNAGCVHPSRRVVGPIRDGRCTHPAHSSVHARDGCAHADHS
jgi:hypothetical protein